LNVWKKERALIANFFPGLGDPFDMTVEDFIDLRNQVDYVHWWKHRDRRV